MNGWTPCLISSDLYHISVSCLSAVVGVGRGAGWEWYSARSSDLDRGVAKWVEGV